jgi:2,3-bisphosphoglycerate-independent phosphoglycerate mutase
MKYLLVVLDGAGDRGENTPLQAANKPNIDSLAAAGKNGLLDLGYKKDVNSDVGYLTLLSCYSKDEYPGRGYIEALGVKLFPSEKALCIRGNFATLDSGGNVKDRRAGRDEAGLEGLAEKLDGMEIDGVRFTVRKSTGHRVVIVASGPGLSDKVKPNDPFKIGVPLPQVTARSPEARRTASVLNRFIYRANKILSGEPVNRKRELPANTILFRNIGRKREVEGFEERFGLRGCCVAGVSVAKGVARFLGMDVIDVKGATGMPDTNLGNKRKAAEKALKKHDFVFLHINGTDILAHDRNRSGKAEFIEKIDSELGKLLEHVNLEETCVVVTCDHRTVSLPESEWKAYEHTRDPVPILISGDGIKPDEVKRFDESSVKWGSLKMSGNELVPLLLMLTKKEKDS